MTFRLNYSRIVSLICRYYCILQEELALQHLLSSA